MFAWVCCVNGDILWCNRRRDVNYESWSDDMHYSSFKGQAAPIMSKKIIRIHPHKQMSLLDQKYVFWMSDNSEGHVSLLWNNTAQLSMWCGLRFPANSFAPCARKLWRQAPLSTNGTATNDGGKSKSPGQPPERWLGPTNKTEITISDKGPSLAPAICRRDQNNYWQTEWGWSENDGGLCLKEKLLCFSDIEKQYKQGHLQHSKYSSGEEVCKSTIR